MTCYVIQYNILLWFIILYHIIILYYSRTELHAAWPGHAHVAREASGDWGVRPDVNNCENPRKSKKAVTEKTMNKLSKRYLVPPRSDCMMFPRPSPSGPASVRSFRLWHASVSLFRYRFDFEGPKNSRWTELAVSLAPRFRSLRRRLGFDLNPPPFGD